MVSDYKESAIKRKDFRRQKEDPQIPKKKGKTKGIKKFKLVAKNFSWKIFTDEKPADFILGKYNTLESAEQALKNQQHDLFWSEHELKIEEI